MDATYKFFSRTYGNLKHIQCEGNHGISNYNMIAENVYDIYKNTNYTDFNIKFIKSIDDNNNQYKFIPTNKIDWTKTYIYDDNIVAYLHIEPYQEIFYVGGRIKSNTFYCCLNKFIIPKN